MKKTFALLMAGLLLLTVTAGAEETVQAPTFETLSDLEWLFTSGAGAWYTVMQIGPDGTFTGDFHDSEMGDAGEDYPYGTVYGCLFHGEMTLGGQTGEYAWEMHVDALELDEGQVPETIEDGIRYVTAEPYGISAGADMTLYLPGTPVSALPEGFLYWTQLFDGGAEELPFYGLYDGQADAGFIGEPIGDASEQ